MTRELTDFEFWGALRVGIGSVAALLYRLITGARSSK